jgi:hypothetical protein
MPHTYRRIAPCGRLVGGLNRREALAPYSSNDLVTKASPYLHTLISKIVVE